MEFGYKIRQHLKILKKLDYLKVEENSQQSLIDCSF